MDVLLHTCHAVLRCLVVATAPFYAVPEKRICGGIFGEQVRALVAPQEAWNTAHLLVLAESWPLFLQAALLCLL